MTQKRLALAGGFGGDGGSQSLRERLIEKMYVRGNIDKVHPITALHYSEDHFPVCFSIDLKVEACKKILIDTQPESLLNSRVAGLLMVMQDHPQGYLAQALDDLQINDFGAWLMPRTVSGNVIRPQFDGFGIRPL